ncbi:MAG: pirin family protein [Pseudomonadota bacterium]
MQTIRRSESRGRASFGWLDSRHSFSFGRYYDPEHMGFGPLRVINEDRVLPGRGFDTHGHRDMEILSYVIDGGLEHQDSMGNGSVIRPGDLQRMTAGTGVRHSEYNASDTDPVHFLQIWIEPAEEGLEPGYEQRHFPVEDRSGTLKLLASPEGDGDAVRVHQDVRIYGSLLAPGEAVHHNLGADRIGWVQIVRGDVLVDGEALQAGDGLALEGAQAVELAASVDAELLFFDMAANVARH